MIEARGVKSSLMVASTVRLLTLVAPVLVLTSWSEGGQDLPIRSLLVCSLRR